MKNKINKNINIIICLVAFIIWTVIMCIIFKDLVKGLLFGTLFTLATIPGANSIKKYLNFKNKKYSEYKIKISDIVDIKTYKFGHGSKTMVMVAGLTLNGIDSAVNNVVDQYKDLEDEFTIYLIERRDVVSKDVTIHDFSNDVKLIVDQLNLKDIYLYGVSQGGMICLDFTINHPELVKKLVLASTCLELNDSEKDIFKKFIEYAKKDDYKSINIEFSKLEMNEKYYKQFEELIMSTSGVGSHDNCVRFINLASTMLNYNLSNQIEKVKCPVFVLADKDDKIFEYKHSLEIVEKLNCKSYLYEGYGHIVYDLAPDFISKIKEFYLD